MTSDRPNSGPAPPRSASRRQTRPQQKQILAVLGGDQAQAGRFEQHGPFGRGWQAVVAHRAPHLVMKGIQGRAARKMQHNQSTARLQQPHDLSQRRRRISKMGKRVETEHDVECLARRLLDADVHQPELGFETARPGTFEHGGREIDRNHPAGADGLREPAGDLAGAAADFEQVLAGCQSELPVEFPEPAQGVHWIRPLDIPGGRLAVEEGDAGVLGGIRRAEVVHIGLHLRSTHVFITLRAMNVTLHFSWRQLARESARPNAVLPRRWAVPARAPGRRPLRSCARCLGTIVAAAGLWAAGPLAAETHAHLQSVTATGTSAWSGTTPFTVIGVLLTDPDEMLDSTPDFIPYSGSGDLFRMGGEWQVVVQAALAGDRGGTACYMGQNYGNHPSHLGEEFSYGNEAWTAEVERLNHDPAGGRALRKGDLVAVTANRSLFYGGKRNVNEAHDKDPAADFTLSLVVPDYGLPEPEVLSLASVVNPDDGDPATSEEIFDATRATGGERWQGMRVRLTRLQVVDASGWNPTHLWGARKCRVTDGDGRFFTLRHPRQDLGPAPTGWFDAVGVFNQESGSGSQGTNGYELFLQQVLPASEPALEIAIKTVVSWPGALANYQLLSATALEGPYAPVTNAPVRWEDRQAVLQDPAEASARFYRLERTQ